MEFETCTLLFLLCPVQIPLSQPNGAIKSGEKRGEGPQQEGFQAEEEDGMLDKPLWRYVSDKVVGILGQGLGDRCVLARPLCGVAGEVGEDFRGKQRSFHSTSFLVLNSSCFAVL